MTTNDTLPTDMQRPPWLWASVAGLLVFGLYVLTLAPSTALWDASEYIATAHILGLPHPPGNSFFVVFGRFWILMLEWTGLSVAVRVNLLAAATSAGTAFFWYLVSHRLITPIVKDRAVALVGAGASVLLSATAYTVWNQSNVNEKVYTISMLVIAAVSWLTLRWLDRKDEPGAERLLLVAGYMMVLGSTNHLMSVLPVPAFLLLLAIATPKVFAKSTVWVRAVPLILLGLSLNMFLPVRAAQDPVINEGDPTCDAVAPALVAVWTNGKAGCDALAYNIAREQYQKPPVTERMAPFPDQLNNWWQYFDWQWGRGMEASEMPWGARTPLSLLFLLLGGAGIWAVWSVRAKYGVYLATLAGLLTIGLVFYLNFKYGFSLNSEVASRLRHEVRERDYFFIAGFSLWGMLSGIGLTWTWTVLRERFFPRGSMWHASPILLVAFIPLGLNWSWASRADDYAARDWAYDLLMSVEPYAILFTNGDNDTFPLWYLQEVEGIRRDVTVVVGQYLYTGWYPKQLEELTRPERQRPFEPEQGGGWHEAPATPPTRAITALTHDQMDQIQGGVLPEDQTVRFPDLALVFPAGTELDRASWLALQFILNSQGERPAYFSSGNGLIADMMLQDFGVREGLVTKLDVRNLEDEHPELVQGSEPYGGDWFHLEKSLHLWDEVYSFRGLRDRDIWFDRATLNIPWHFYALSLQISDVIRDHPEYGGRVQEFVEASDAFGIVASGGSRGTPASELQAESVPGG